MKKALKSRNRPEQHSVEVYATVCTKVGNLNCERDSLRVLLVYYSCTNVRIKRILTEKECKHLIFRDRKFKISRKILAGKPDDSGNMNDYISVF